MSVRVTFDGPDVWHNRRTERDTRDWRDGRDKVGIQSGHIAPFAPVSRFTRRRRWRTFSASC